MRISFVCLGNICRSPTAEGVARHLIAERDLEDIEVEGAGTGGWHVGNPPDARATETAARRGIDLDGAARQFAIDDLARLDLVVAMDRRNVENLRHLARGVADAPPIRLLREWDPKAQGPDDLDVPDPYHGGAEGFEYVLDIITRSVGALLDDVASGAGEPQRPPTGA